MLFKHFIFSSLIIPFLFLFLTFKVNGQNSFQSVNQFHSWFYYIGDHKITERWGIHPEFQFRRTGIGRQPQQYILRTAINYYAKDDLYMLSLGYVFNRENPYGALPAEFNLSENRFYQQFDFEHQIGRLYINHRIRQEQRWIANVVGVEDPDSDAGIRPVTQGWPLQHRSRYSLGIAFPLTGKEIETGEFYLYASNEFFFSYGKNVREKKIDENRFQLGIGYQVGSFGRVESGYQYQYLGNLNLKQVEHNHTLVMAWISRFNFWK